MFDYIKNMFDELPIDMAGFAVTPAAIHALKVNKSGVKLKTSEAELFHHMLPSCHSYVSMHDQTSKQQLPSYALG